MVRNISANLLGLACGLLVTFAIYYFHYANDASNFNSSESLKYSQHTYTAIDSSNFVGLARIAANKPLERNAHIKLAYSIKDVCEGIKEIKFSEDAPGEFSLAKFGNYNDNDLLIEKLTNIKGSDIGVICIAENNHQNDYLMVSSSYLRDSLKNANLQYGYVAIEK